MRILVVTQHFWPENFRINDIVEGFVQDGLSVDVLCGLPNYPKGEWFDGYSAEYEADQLSDEVANMMMPLLGLEDDMYDDFAASVSGMMVRVYGVAIVKPAEGKTQDVVDAMDAYVQSQQKSMEHYLEDQYQIASAARVATVPTGEVVMVCCEDSDTVFENIKKALAA